MTAKTTASLSFQTQSADQNSISDGTVGLRAQQTGAGTGTLCSHSGRVLIRSKSAISERVKIKSRNDEGTPKPARRVRTATSSAAARDSRLRRVGSKIEVGWAFRRRIRGSVRALKVGRPSPRDECLLPAGRFDAPRVTIVLACLKKVVGERKKLTYRWRATVELGPLVESATWPSLR